MAQVEQFIKGWLSHRKVLDALLQKVDDEHVTFQPWDGALSLGALALHIAQAGETFVTAIKTGEFTHSPAWEFTTISDVREQVTASTERTISLLQSLTEDDLLKQIGERGPAIGLLNALKDHEVHHKGQLFVYVRLIGVKEMPYFVDRGH